MQLKQDNQFLRVIRAHTELRILTLQMQDNRLPIIIGHRLHIKHLLETLSPITIGHPLHIKHPLETLSPIITGHHSPCLLYTSDAADD